jgi:H+/Cl- antiporter ClcA
MSYAPVPASPESRVPEWQLHTLIVLFLLDGLIISIVGVLVIWAVVTEPAAVSESDPFDIVMLFFVGAFIVSVAALAFASSWGLRSRRDWALTTSHVVCIVNALFFPVGTVLAAFGWWVLRRTSFEIS